MSDQPPVHQPPVQHLNPNELVKYQQFFQSQTQVLFELGKITVEYESAKEQAKSVLNQINSQREQWVLKTLSERKINPVLGDWSIDPKTGHILNQSKLHVVDK